ncbi:hypothetical protein G9A89_005330 [Geosiphon pyriformis]|nr:hypothetical protein G9A89_005330 [Geosiphon pyriformis]
MAYSNRPESQLPFYTPANDNDFYPTYLTENFNEKQEHDSVSTLSSTLDGYGVVRSPRNMIRQSQETLGTPRRIRPIEKRNFRFFCISCPPCLWISCGIFWTVILALTIVLGSITFANKKLCRDLNIDDVAPSIQIYDPNILNEIKILTSGNFLKGEVIISQTNLTTVKGASVLTQVVSAGNKKINSKATSVNSQYLLTIAQPGYASPYKIISYWSLPPKCSKARIEIIFPQEFNNDNQSMPIKVISSGFEMKINKNLVGYFDKEFKFWSQNSGIDVKNFSSKSVELMTRNGDIKGVVSGIETNFKTNTINGNINLTLNTLSNATQPHIEINSFSGNINLNLNHTFSGNFSVSTTSGNINLSNQSSSSSSSSSSSLSSSTTREVDDDDDDDDDDDALKQLKILKNSFQRTNQKYSIKVFSSPEK